MIKGGNLELRKKYGAKFKLPHIRFGHDPFRTLRSVTLVFL